MWGMERDKVSTWHPLHSSLFIISNPDNHTHLFFIVAVEGLSRRMWAPSGEGCEWECTCLMRVLL